MPSPGADRRGLIEASLGLVLLAGVACLWRALVFVPEPASTPIRLVDGPRFRPASVLELPAPPADTAATARLLFAGDIMQHRRQAGDEFHASYAEVAPLVRRADLAVANLEFPVDTLRPVGPEPGSTTFNGSVRHVDAIAAAGFDLLQTANNHAYDQGAEGVSSTWRVLRSRGIEPVGTAPTLAQLDSAPVVLRNVGGIRMGFVAYSMSPNRYPDPRGRLAWPPREMPLFALAFGEWDGQYRDVGLALFQRHVRLARAAGAEFLVALVHWGEEWQMQPSDDQRRAAHDLVDAGVDLVVGGHSHVLNPAEVYRGRLVAYSLGDLVADFRPYQTRTGALLEVQVMRGVRDQPRVTGFTWYPTIVGRDGHIIRFARPGSGPEADQALEFARSRLGNVRKGP
jgi:poly-gamma-glutamate capsule biosynthesis protein CapA/YwtB (metallophosphatase superfamily)